MSFFELEILAIFRGKTQCQRTADCQSSRTHAHAYYDQRTFYTKGDINFYTLTNMCSLTHCGGDHSHEGFL